MTSVSMRSRERLWAAINGEPVDRIPVSPRCWRYAMWQRCSKMELAKKFGFDCFEFGTGTIATPINDVACEGRVRANLPEIKIDIQKSRKGATTVFDRTFHTPGGKLHDVVVLADQYGEYGVGPQPTWKEPLIKTREDVELLAYLLPDPRHIRDHFAAAHRLDAAYGDDGLVGFRPTGSVDQVVLDSLGPEEALILSLTGPDMFNRLIEIVDDWHMEVTKVVLEDGWKIIFDAFYNFSLSVGWSPNFYRDTVAPIIRKHTEQVHSYGAKMMFYDDGKMGRSIDYIVDAGVDIIQTMTPPPIGDLDFELVAEKHGGKVCFNGGVDTVLLRFGKPDEIEKKTRELIDIFGDTGRLIIGTSDSITEDTPEENMWAFFNTAREYGVRK